ncbi:MAG TPA: hypothetical protein GXX38_01980 [Clostridia bacterium]|nr:hypothetical protein [Clostridia bacterium]
MSPLLAGILALALAFIFNRLLVKSRGLESIFLEVPLVEEVSKLGAALIFDAPFISTYLIFGVGEAFYDLKSKKPISLNAALFSIASHYLFGVLAQLVWEYTANIFLLVILTTTAHALWNKLILILGQKLEAK